MEKKLLDDMLSERAKLREGIPDSLRYGGTALAASVGAVFALAIGKDTPDPHRLYTALQLIALLLPALLIGFSLKLREMTERSLRLQKRINKALALNPTLRPPLRRVSDIDVRKWGNMWANVAMVVACSLFWAALSVMFVDIPGTPAAKRGYVVVQGLIGGLVGLVISSGGIALIEWWRAKHHRRTAVTVSGKTRSGKAAHP